jgi:DNA-binding IclR family transcriptional regulator
LDFLARHEEDSFTLSELCRRLEMSKSTGHSILTTLVDSGFVMRDGDRTYFLGPAVIPLGEAAAGHHRAVAVARREAEHLARELDAECLVNMVVNDSIMILARAGHHVPLPTMPTFPAVQRWPFAPPLGVIFVAWWEPARVEEWLAKSAKALSAEQRTRFLAVLEEVRRRGFSVSALGTDPGDPLEELVQSVTGANREPEVARLIEAFMARVRYDEDYNVGPLDPAVAYDVTSLAAPVFDRDGAVTLALILQSLPQPLGAKEIERYGRRLLQRAEAVTRAGGGRPRGGR